MNSNDVLALETLCRLKHASSVLYWAELDWPWHNPGFLETYWIFFWRGEVLGFELRTLCLLSSCLTTWIIPQALPIGTVLMAGTWELILVLRPDPVSELLFHDGMGMAFVHSITPSSPSWITYSQMPSPLLILYSDKLFSFPPLEDLL
jgi:hypothetical protein